MNSLKGHLLVAAPQLADPNFARAVVLMIEHDEHGAFGVVLNRPSGRKVNEIWEQLANDPCDCGESVNVGGPVGGPLLALHTHKSLAEAEIMPGVYLSAQREHLDELVRRPDGGFRLFSGYSGWGGGQLESELKQGGWITKKATKQYVFAAEEDLWHRVGQDITEDVYRRGLKLKNFPDDPSLN